MIRSMTGFGRSRFEVEGSHFDVEVRTVNHRHLDVRARLPRELSDLEADVKQRIQSRLDRGKADISITLLSGDGMSPELEVDLAVAEGYVRAVKQLAEIHELETGLAAATLLTMQGVTRVVEPELPRKEVEAALLSGVDAAIVELIAMREDEGGRLAADLDARLTSITRLVEHFGTRSEDVRLAAKDRLEKRTEKLQLDTGLLDEARLHQEIVIALDRLDITEELVRLGSHVEQFRKIMSEADVGSPVGRRLEFLLQEMGREANTVGSKANDAALSHSVVELKSELERMREQVLNVE